MRKYILVALALAAVATAATAVPAFTASSGSVTVSVTARAPAAPCVTVTPNTVNFGTLPLSTAPGSASGQANITIGNCGTAGQNLLAAATNASGPSGSWTLFNPAPGGIGSVGSPCPTTDRFYLSIFMFVIPAMYLGETSAPVLSSVAGPPALLAAGTNYPSQLEITMPCQGSNGPGEAKTLTATFTAVVP